MRRTAIFVFAIALCGASLRAQKPRTIDYGGNFNFEAPAQEEPASLMKIFSNLGAPTSAYTNAGWAVTGPASASAFGVSEFIAMPFTPKANAHVSQVRAAIQYVGSGANRVNLSLYSDVGGIPGVPMADPITVKNLPSIFTCCKLAVANFTSGIPVTAGTQYWVVADTPLTGTGSDFDGIWFFVPPSKLLVGTSSGDSGGGAWYAFHADIQEPAGAVYGTIP